MVEVMNRATRRAKGRGRADHRIRVTTQITVVPMANTESYLSYEIVKEGQWRSVVPVVIVQPAIDGGRADDEWLAKLLSRMSETRMRHGPKMMQIAVGDAEPFELDVGLIDIIVSFGSMGSKKPLIPSTVEAEHFLYENLRHFDEICRGAFHDQMILAVAPHLYERDGSLLYHFHNLIFGMRQQVRGDMDILGTLDVEPLLKALSSSGPIRIVGGMSH